MPVRTKSFDEYMATAPDDKRPALEELRKQIHAAAPGAQEYIGYGLAAFKLNGKPLVAIGYAAQHCAFYPMNGHTVEAFKEELKGFETSKGTIRFKPDRPLPEELVDRLVKARIEENSR